MTIEEAKNRRLTIEDAILKMLEDYEGDGVVIVRSIDLRRVSSHSGDSRIVSVALTVEIGGNHG